MGSITRIEKYKQEKGTILMEGLIETYGFKISPLQLNHLLGILSIKRGSSPQIIVNADLGSKYQKLTIVYGILLYKELGKYPVIPQELFLDPNELDPNIYRLAVDILLPNSTFQGKYTEWIQYGETGICKLGSYFDVPNIVVRDKIKMKGLKE